MCFWLLLGLIVSLVALECWTRRSSAKLFQQLESVLGPRIVKRESFGVIFVRRKNRNFVQVEPKGDDLVEFRDDYHGQCTRSITDFVAMIKEENKKE